MTGGLPRFCLRFAMFAKQFALVQALSDAGEQFLILQRALRRYHDDWIRGGGACVHYDEMDLHNRLQKT